MAKFAAAGKSVFRVDATAGGTLNALTAYVDSVTGMGKEFDALDITAFTDAAERIIPGIERSNEVRIRGHFDDAATTGPDVILNTVVGTIVSIEWNPVGTAAGNRKMASEALCIAYIPTAEVKGRVEFEAVFKRDGAMTVGTN